MYQPDEIGSGNVRAFGLGFGGEIDRRGIAFRLNGRLFGDGGLTFGGGDDGLFGDTSFFAAADEANDQGQSQQGTEQALHDVLQNSQCRWIEDGTISL